MYGWVNIYRLVSEDILNILGEMVLVVVYGWVCGWWCGSCRMMGIGLIIDQNNLIFHLTQDLNRIRLVRVLCRY